MALVSSKEILLKAQKEGYAVGAFNAENMEMVQAIVAAAEDLSSPVIIQTTPGSLQYADNGKCRSEKGESSGSLAFGSWKQCRALREGDFIRLHFYHD